MAYPLAITRYWYYQYCMAHSIQTRVRRGSLILPNNRAIVLHQIGQCRWAGGVNRWLIRAQQPRRKTISCKGQLTRRAWWAAPPRYPCPPSALRQSLWTRIRLSRSCQPTAAWTLCGQVRFAIWRRRYPRRQPERVTCVSKKRSLVGLYTILLLPICYGV